MTVEEHSFRWLVFYILTGIALVPVAIIFLVSFSVLILFLLMRSDRPVPTPVPEEDISFARLDGLEVT